METGLKIKVGADVVAVTKSLAELEDDFKDLQKTISKTTDGKELLSLNKQLDDLGRTIKAIKSAGKIGFDDFGQKAATSLQKVANPANSAAFALTNLGRVAQDLPFGFVSIQNNLNPLLESFQRLKAETGSSGSAVKALLGSLTGAGGLGLALSVVSSALTFASFGFGAWTRGFGAAKKELDSVTQAIKDLVKPITDITSAAAGSAQGEIAKVNALVSVLKNHNETRDRQKRALEELRQVNKSYFGDLTLEESSLKRLTQLQQEYTQSVVKAAIIKNLEGEIGKVGGELFRAQRSINEQLKERGVLQNEIIRKNQQIIQDNAQKGVRTFFNDKDAYNSAIIADNIKKQQKAIEPLRKQFNDLNGELQEFISQSLDLKPLNPEKTKEKIKKSIYYFQQGLTPVEIPLKLINDPTLKVKEIFNKIESDLKAESFSGFTIFDGNQISTQATQAFFSFKKYWDDQAKKNPLYLDTSNIKLSGIGNDFSKFLSAQAQESIDQMKRIQQQAVEIRDFFGGPLAETISGVFRTIATEGKISMRQVGDAVKGLIIDLVAAVIKAAVLALVLKAFGASKVGSFANIFKFNLGLGGSNAVGLASGGIVPSGYPNDTFPARLSSGEAVIPLDRLNDMVGSSRDSGHFVARLQGAGPDLILFLERQMRSQKRSF